MANDGTWTLSYGIHNGTFTSRDSISVGGLASLDACYQKIREIEKANKRFGYVIWWAQANGPNGEKQTVHGGNSNYNKDKSFSEMEREQPTNAITLMTTTHAEKSGKGVDGFSCTSVRSVRAAYLFSGESLFRGKYPNRKLRSGESRLLTSANVVKLSHAGNRRKRGTYQGKMGKYYPEVQEKVW